MKQIHISWVIAAACGGLVLGIALCRLDIWQNSSLVLLIAFGLSLLLVGAVSRTRVIVPVAIIGAILIGVARGRVVLIPTEQAWQKVTGDTIMVAATIDDDPTLNKSNLTMSLGDIEIKEVDGQKVRRPMDGKIWASLKGGAKLSGQLKRYDRITITGLVDSGFGSYNAVMARSTLMGAERAAGADPLGRLRGWFGEQLSKVMNADEAALGMGLVAGQKASLSSQMKQAFTSASLTHILVASGYNLTILVRFCRRLFAKRSRLIALISSLTLILLFSVMVGSSASMNRAVLVSALSLLAWYVGRSIHPVVLLLFTSAITAMAEPGVIFGDVGWYLSFFSFAGVIILAPLLNDLVNKRDNSLMQIVLETLAATLLTVPIVAYFMGTVSLAGIITSVLVLPIIPLTMALTFGAGLVAAIAPVAIASLAALPAKLLLDYIIAIAKWGASLPFSNIAHQPTLAPVIIYYAALTVGVVILWHTAKGQPKDNCVV